MTEEKGNTIQKVFIGDGIGYGVSQFVEESIGQLMYVRFPDHSVNKATIKITVEFYPDGEAEDE